MGIKTGKQYLESLRDGRRIVIDGEIVKDVTRDRRFRRRPTRLRSCWTCSTASTPTP